MLVADVLRAAPSEEPPVAKRPMASKMLPCARMRMGKRRLEMKRFASSLALASALAVTALSPAVAAHHRPHFVFARIGAGVCDGMVCTGSFFATLPAACGLVMVPSTTRFVRPVKHVVCPSGLGVTMYRMIK
jgi:hypothetical protein